MGNTQTRNFVQSVANASARASVGTSSAELTLTEYLQLQQSDAARQRLVEELDQLAVAAVSGVELGAAAEIALKTDAAFADLLSPGLEMTAVSCGAETLATQPVPLDALAANALLTAEQEPDPAIMGAVNTLVNCRMTAVRSVDKVSALQQAAAGAAFTETVGFDVAEFAFVIGATVAGVLAVVFVGMQVSGRISGVIAGRIVPVLVTCVILAGAAVVILTLLAHLDPIRPAGAAMTLQLPGGTADPATAAAVPAVIYPFLDPTVPAVECGPVVFSDREGFATPQALAEWVEAYNERVDVHTAKLDKALLPTMLVVTGSEAVGEGPAEDARLTSRWPIIKVAVLNQRTGTATAYAGEPEDHLRSWSQWSVQGPKPHPGAAPAGQLVHAPNPSYRPPTRVAVLELLREARTLLGLLRCVEAGQAAPAAGMNEAGLQQCDAERIAQEQTATDAWYSTDARFSLPGLPPQALWHMLAGEAPTAAALPADSLDALPTGLTVASMTTEAQQVDVPDIAEEGTVKVTPMLRQLQAVEAAVAALPGTNVAALDAWKVAFSAWKRKLEAGWGAYDTGSPYGPDSWRDVTIVFPARLQPVSTLAINARSASPIELNVWIIVGTIGVVALFVAWQAYSVISSRADERRLHDRLAEIQAESSGKGLGVGGGGDASGANLSALLRNMFAGNR